MGRASLHQMKPRKQPILDHYIQASVGQGVNDEGHYGELRHQGIEDYERALEIRRALYRSAKHLKVSLKAEVEQAADGTYVVVFHAINKAHARAYIIAKTGGDPSKLDYNPYVRQQ